MQEVIRESEMQGAIVASTECGLQLCVTFSVAHNKKIHCKHMGCSPVNRMACGINARDFIDQGEDIDSVCFSLKKCDDA